MKKLLLVSILCATFSPCAFAGYGYSYKITVDHTQAGSTDSASFPILVNIVGNADFKTVANGGFVQHTATLNGQTVPTDLIVATSSTCATQVTAWEVASYDGTNGNVEIWVNQGTLSHTVDTIFYLCLGNAAVTTYQSTATSVWDSSFAEVVHLPNGTTLGAGCSSKVCDSTSNGNHCTNTNTATAAAGQVDGAAVFNGSSQWLNCGTSASLSITPNVTFSAWVNFASFPSASSFAGLFGKRNTAATDANYGVNYKGSGTFPAGDVLQLFYASSSTVRVEPVRISTNFTTATWYYIAGVLKQNSTNTDATVYKNAVSVASSTLTGAPATNSDNLAIGSSTGSIEFAAITVDEFRLSSAARSADWITAEYNMSKPSQSMVTLGSRVSGAKGMPIVADAARGTSLRGLH